jgi:putative PEP-CTERM system TPR-repeat lipoprotein
MPDRERHSSWRHLVVAGALAALASSAAAAKDSTAAITEAEQSIAQGNLKAAEIQLRNAIRDTPQDPVLRARLAAVYLQLGDAAAAEREARAAGERQGNEADYLPVLADALLRQAKLVDLLDEVQPGDRDPVLESKVRTALGTAAAGLGHRDQAETLLGAAITLDPGAVPAKIQLARLVSRSKPAEADKLIDEAITADPRSAEALQVKGEILRGRGDREGAMQLFDAALKIDPDNTTAHLSRADLYIALGQYPAADAEIDPILKAFPDQFMANYLRGVELAKQQSYAEADRIFEHISPGFAVLWAGYYLHGATQLALDQYAKAEASLAKYLSHEPDHAKAARLIALAALKQHAPDRAIKYLKLLLDNVPADAATLSLLGKAYLADNKPEIALQQFEAAAALDPQNPQINTGIALSKIDTGHTEQGLAQLEALFAGDANAAVAGPTLVLSELRAGRVGKAGEVAASLVERDPKNPLYLTLQGLVRAAQRDFLGAEALFQKAKVQDPSFMPARRDLARLYLATGRAAEAKRVYADLLSKKPDAASNSPSTKASDSAALQGLAEIAIAQQQWAEAIDHLNHARSIARTDPAPGLRLVSLYEQRAIWDSARVVAVELGQQFPQDANVAEAQGRTCFEAGDIKGAIASYKRAHELAPGSLSILAGYVGLLRQSGYVRDARDVLQDAVAQHPRNAAIKAELIRVEAALDGLDTALFEARGFAKDDPDNPLYDQVSAELYEAAGRIPEAIAVLAKALAARPSDQGLRIALARLCSRSGDLRQAEKVLVAGLQADPTSSAVGTALARQYLASGRAPEAKQLFADVLARQPNDVGALLGLAAVATTEWDWPQATDYLNHARAAQPTDPAPGIALVNGALLRQEWQNALTASTRLAEQFPTNAEVLDAKARAQTASGDSAGALATYQRIYQLSPSSIPAAANYVAVLNGAKEFVKAQTVLRAALARDPKNDRVKGELIRVEAEIGGLRAGLAKANALTREDPENPLYDIVSAELYEQAGQRDAAVDLLEQAVATRPDATALIVALASLYGRRGDPGKAEALLQTRLKAAPKDVALRSALGLLDIAQHQDDAAIAEYQRIVAEQPADAAALNNLARLYQHKGELATARVWAEQAVAAAPRTPRIDDTLGAILLAQGATDRALIYLSAASLLAPQDPDIQYHLAVALDRLGRPEDARARLERLLGADVAFPDKAEAEQLLQQLKRG